MLEAGVLPCVTGFIASDPAGNLTTLGRGGSDLTASIVGNATDATEVILSKVESEKDSKEGFMTAWKPGWIGIVHQNNPHLTIKNMSFEEAGELANLGRKVLHRHAVYPLLEKRIPIRICNTLDGNHPGTLISDLADNMPSGSLFGASAADRPVTEITMVELADNQK
jgi:aspartokinase